MERISKEEMFMRIAEAVSLRSTCKRLQVGSIITDSEMKKIIAIGYNGNYAGGPNECDSDEAGNCGCIHSEQNSLYKGGNDREVIFLTDSPCVVCSKAMINAGIKKVYYRKEYRDLSGVELLKEVGIEVTKL